MRITLPLLFPQLRLRMKRDSWQKWRKLTISDPGTKRKMEKNVQDFQAVDLNEYFKTTSPLFQDLDAVPLAQPIFPSPPKQDRSHPDWHNEFIKMYSPTTFPVEGIKQAQGFTKAILRPGLPFQLDQHLEKKIDDSMIQRIICQAFMWDPQLEGKPLLRNLRLWFHSFAKERGILQERTNMLLAKNFIRSCESISPSTALNQMLVHDEEFCVNTSKEGFNVQFKMKPLVTILSRNQYPTPKIPVQDYANEEIPSIYPFSTVANFVEANIYKEYDTTPFNSSTFSNVNGAIYSHTIPGSFTHIHPRWTLDRFGGATILCAFSTSLLNAKRTYGDNVKDLPKPVTTFTIHMTGQDFQFAVFQLNTLDLDNESSKIKNIVWMSDKMPLFDTCKYVTGLETFTGYNPQIFRYFASLLCPNNNS